MSNQRDLTTTRAGDGHQAALRLHVDGKGRHQTSEVDGEIERVDLEGLAVKAVDASALGRYVWLDLDLGDGEPVRALGEVMQRRDPAAVAVDIRFKHLFPDYRVRLERALAG